MTKYILLFNGRSAEFTELQIALHVAYLLAEVFDVDIVEHIDDIVTDRDEIVGITCIKRRE